MKGLDVMRERLSRLEAMLDNSAHLRALMKGDPVPDDLPPGTAEALLEDLRWTLSIWLEMALRIPGRAAPDAEARIRHLLAEDVWPRRWTQTGIKHARRAVRLIDAATGGRL